MTRCRFLITPFEYGVTLEPQRRIQSSDAARLNRAGQLDEFDLAALLLCAAGRPGTAEQILTEHVPQEDGRCAGCRWVVRPYWPCFLVTIAERMQGLRDRPLPPATTITSGT
jgi:hypothetical protein